MTVQEAGFLLCGLGVLLVVFNRQAAENLERSSRTRLWGPRPDDYVCQTRGAPVGIGALLIVTGVLAATGPIN